ncbi:MAG TPA: hypothetical protein VD866_08125 [Urbifossiella sp.]|nr:hypothetical protein [Urbifossiella sp.]
MTPRDAFIDRVLSPLGEEWVREHMDGKPVLDQNGRTVGKLEFTGATPCGDGVSLGFTIRPAAAEPPALDLSAYGGSVEGAAAAGRRILADRQRAAFGPCVGIVNSVVTGPDGVPVVSGRLTDEAVNLVGDLLRDSNPWRDRFDVIASPIGYTNTGGGTTIPADLTVADLVATMQQLAPPEPEQVIITPSLDELRAVVPFEAPNAIQRRSPTDFRTTDGVRVVVTKLADRPRLVPASWVDRLVPSPMAAVFDEFAALQGYRYRLMQDAAANATRPVKPPLGVMPAHLWREDHPQPTVDDRCDRVVAMRAASRRYVEAGREPLPEWATEIEEHAAALQSGFVDGVETFLDQLDALADSPEPIVVVEGPPDAAPTP